MLSMKVRSRCTATSFTTGTTWQDTVSSCFLAVLFAVILLQGCPLTLHHNCAKVCNFRGCLGLVLRRIGESAKLFPDLQLNQTRGLMTGTKLGISVSSCGSSKTFHLEVSLATFIEKMNKITFPSKMPINVTNFNPTTATKSKLYYCPTC